MKPCCSETTTGWTKKDEGRASTREWKRIRMEMETRVGTTRPECGACRIKIMEENKKTTTVATKRKNRSKNRDRYAYSVIIVHSLSSSCYLAVTGLTTWWGGLFPANQLVPSSRRRRALSLPSDFGETASVAGDFDFFSNTYRAATTTTTKRVRKEERNQEEKKRREGSVNGRVAVVRSLWYILLIFCSAC